MKLKKIASLLLAGVMAVSMLAGCSGNGNGNSGNSTDNGQVSTSSMVTAITNAQADNEDVKITFTADSSLTSVLSKMVEIYGTDGDVEANSIIDYIKKSTGTEYKTTTDFYDSDTEAEDVKDGEKIVALGVAVVDSTEAYNESAAMKFAADDVNDTIAALVATTFAEGEEGTANGAEYIDYSYTGTISDMVTVKSVNGEVTYYVAYTITQTCAVETFTV